MSWIYFYLIPLFAAWKKRSNDLATEVFSLYKTMFSAFLAIWSIPHVLQGLSQLLPGGNILIPWIGMVCVIAIWLISALVIGKVIEKGATDGLDIFFFPPMAAKILVPVVVFFNISLICALIFSAISLSPASKYASFVFKNDSLCASARFRVLCSSFFIDRFSWQSASINQRRRAFDIFVPECPNAAPHKISTAALKRKAQ